MPVKKVSGGYKYGTKGKVYKSKEDAEKQGRAIRFKNVSNLYLMEYALALKESKDYDKSIKS